MRGSDRPPTSRFTRRASAGVKPNSVRNARMSSRRAKAKAPSRRLGDDHSVGPEDPVDRDGIARSAMIRTHHQPVDRSPERLAYPPHTHPCRPCLPPAPHLPARHISNGHHLGRILHLEDRLPMSALTKAVCPQVGQSWRRYGACPQARGRRDQRRADRIARQTAPSASARPSPSA
jgi:hypothetical protein